MFESSWIETALGTEPPKCRFAHFNRIISDSRKIQPGDCFIAIVGEKMDGHDYVIQALGKGASGVIVHKTVPHLDEHLQSANIYTVNDTLEAYRKLGASWRAKFDIPVIGITGSVGKTTSKEILTSLLQGSLNSVLKTIGSQNGFVGIPMTLLDLRVNHKAAIIEIGIDEIGAMLPHMELVRPTACLLTAIGPEHLEKLKDVETVAKEELISLQWTHDHNGVISVNLDDPYISPHVKSWKKENVTTFSLTESTADYFGEWSESTQTITITDNKGEKTKVKTPLPGIHNARNFLGAFALAKSLGQNTEKLIDGFIHHFENAEGRSRWEHVDQLGIDVLCDYYNASPVSVGAALDVLKSHTAKGKKWVALADMLELGTDELKFHRDLSKKIVGAFSNVLLFGNRMKSLHEELKHLKFSGENLHFETIEELTTHLKKNIHSGDICLIKGSRSMKMERVWKALHESKS
ncbi:MAG: UDP-N-acetylmuramoyl-tripeptide--D-alanyl-D-alanine ligase [Xanthomonadaceae bacterium]|nr:UDP-N-acetylmuramoyl-tripeptide--D-alanyl-D-alanine ligase [Xanthomonadaceae bacterium]